MVFDSLLPRAEFGPDDPVYNHEFYFDTDYSTILYAVLLRSNASTAKPCDQTRRYKCERIWNGTFVENG